MQIEFDKEIYNDVFYPLLFDESRYLVLKGGAGSGKSVFASQKYEYRVLNEFNHRIVFIRKVGNTIRNSQFKMFLDLINKHNLNHLLEVKSTDMTFRVPATNSEIISIGMDDREKIKSLADPTSFWYEEPTELDERDFEQMSMRLRGMKPNYKQEVLTFNPIDEKHWLKKRFFPEAIEQALTKKPVARMEEWQTVGDERILVDSTLCHTTYKDNKFIDAQYKAKLESLKERDLNYYKIYCLGHWGSVGHRVFNPTPKIVNKPFPEDDYFDDIFYGLDFGYHHATALVKVGVRDQVHHLKEVCYLQKMTNSQIVEYFVDNGLCQDEYTIYADSAEPDRIDEFAQAGFNIIKAKKGQNTLNDSIEHLKSIDLVSYSENTNLNWEFANFKYREDKEGNPIEGEYVKLHDDCIAAARYACYSRAKLSEVKVGFV